MSSPAAHQAIDRAIAVAARAGDVPPEAIEVESVEEREWPSSALGCPRPGMMYAQVIIPGYCIRLRGPAGERWTLHTDQGQRAILSNG